VKTLFLRSKLVRRTWCVIVADILLDYGEEIIKDFIEDAWKKNIVLLEPEKPAKDFSDLEVELDRVLKTAPAGGKSLADVLREVYTQGKDVTIIVDDNTRPNKHTKILLPMIFIRLKGLGITDQDIKILIASGTHRTPTEDEMSNKIFGPDLYEEHRHRISAHDCYNGNLEIGKSSRGTPIQIDERAMNSCLLIPLTDSELHYFAGVAGTVKEICPGIASKETVNLNHTRMFDRQLGFVPTCRLADNPIITEMKEIAGIINEHVPIFGIDVIFFHDEIVYVNAGDLIGLHNNAAPIISKLRTVEVEQPADLVIVSVGPLGINLYQAGKGIHAAWNSVRKDGKGKILVLAPCLDGAGNDAYYNAMHSVEEKSIPEALQYVLDHYCSVKTFNIGNQKPVDLLRILKDVGEGNIEMITELDREELFNTFRIVKIPLKGSVAETLREYLRKFFLERRGEKSVVYVIPDAGTYVKIKTQST
jgi:nickel-dependent lactate racemase